MTFTAQGLDLLKYDPGEKTINLSHYVGIIPPFCNCWFEYRNGETECPDAGVHLYSLSRDEIAYEFPDDGFAFVVYLAVFYRHVVNGVSHSALETVALFALDNEGRLISFEAMACRPEKADQSLPENQPNCIPIFITLVSLMLIHGKVVKSTLSPEVVKSRQQRRYEERHPSRATPPLMRYYTLVIDPERKQSDGSSGKGGSEMPWHRVRGFLRHLKSGKVVPVRPYSRGNPLKGVIVKDYKVKGVSNTKAETAIVVGDGDCTEPFGANRTNEDDVLISDWCQRCADLVDTPASRVAFPFSTIKTRENPGT